MVSNTINPTITRGVAPGAEREPEPLRWAAAAAVGKRRALGVVPGTTDFVWILCEICVNFMWVVCEFCVNFVWIWCDLFIYIYIDIEWYWYLLIKRLQKTNDSGEKWFSTRVLIPFWILDRGWIGLCLAVVDIDQEPTKGGVLPMKTEISTSKNGYGGYEATNMRIQLANMGAKHNQYEWW